MALPRAFLETTCAGATSIYAGQGAPELVRAVQDVTANDTSFGVAHWPLSPLEETVYETAQFLNHRLLQRLPIGEDVKVMGARVADDIRLTCAVPFLAHQVHSFIAGSNTARRHASLS